MKKYLGLLIGIIVLLASCGTKDQSQRRQIRSVTDLMGSKIGVQLGTVSDVLATSLEQRGGGTQVQRFTKSADAVQALTQGKIDCMVEDEQPAKAFLRLNTSLRILPETFGKANLAICVAKGNEGLQMELNAALEQLKKEGVLDSIVARHVDRSIAVAYQVQEDVKRDGKLKFSTNSAYEPFEYYDEGKLVGIDIDVANAIGDKLQKEVEFVDMEFDAVITAVQTGKTDAAISCITVTPERLKNVNFTIPYTVARQVVMVNTGEVAANTQTFLDKLDSCFITGHRYQYLLKGLGNTLTITFFAIILSLALGTLIAIIRSTHARNGNHLILNALCQVYLTIVRGTPTMVQLLIIYYVVFASADVDKIFVAIIAFGLNSAAYVAEVIRAGIMSVDVGQMEAGRSLGLSYSKTMRLVILPQAFKNVLPAIGNELITLLKETSISGYIGLVDLTKGSDIIRSITYDAMMPLGVVALIYLVIVIALYTGVQRLEKNLRKNERT